MPTRVEATRGMPNVMLRCQRRALAMHDHRFIDNPATFPRLPLRSRHRRALPQCWHIRCHLASASCVSSSSSPSTSPPPRRSESSCFSARQRATSNERRLSRAPSSMAFSSPSHFFATRSNCASPRATHTNRRLTTRRLTRRDARSSPRFIISKTARARPQAAAPQRPPSPRTHSTRR